MAVLCLKIGNVIGLVVNPVVLFILYFGIITPFGMFLKICGRDHLKVKKKILIIGIAYKPNDNDIRESSGIEIFKKIKKYNNLVEYHDDKIDHIYILGKKYFSKTRGKR